MNQDKSPKFMGSMAWPPGGRWLMSQMNVIRNTAMRMYGNYAVQSLIFLRWRLLSMDP
jgi:hypothetical protein